MTIKQQWTIVLALVATSASATETPIQSVTLYPGSATVERVVQLTPGMTQVEFKGLLANFNTETVRLQADPGIQVGQIVTRDQDRTDSPSPRAATLEAKLLALQDQIALIDADSKSAQLVQGYLERLGGGEAATGRGAPADPKTLLATLDAIRKGGADALQRIHANEVRKRALGEQLKVGQADLAKVQANTRASRVMSVQLAVRQAGKLTLSYQVNGAGWKPAYRASLDSNSSNVELERMATISQKTGEDWSGVRLRLSTGQPNLTARMPDPSPWLLDFRPPPVPGAAPAPPPQMFVRAPVTVMGSRNARAATPSADAYLAPVLETQGNFATEFAVPAQVDLASDGREISVALSRQTLAVKQTVRISPRTAGTSAVLTAQAARPEGVWLPGQVQLRRDGSYVGALQWDPLDSERLTLAFGSDPLMQVELEHRKADSGSAGLFNRDDQRRISDSYKVTSKHRQPVEILVLEPSPVSQSDEVKVKIAVSPEPSVRDWQGRRGLIAWEKTLEPNETARFDVDYVIDHPKAGVVQGLP